MIRSALSIAFIIAAIAGCQKRDPLYCGNHPDDPLCIAGDGGTADVPDGFVTISGQVSGLTGAGLVLQNNGGDDKLITGNGAFQFPSGVMMGTTYNVTVGSQPTNPSENCTVTGGTGTANADVTDVMVTCAPAAYTVGGNVAGLPGGATVTLQNNGTDDKTINASGTFTFATKVQSGQPYNVTIKGQTGGATCSVSAGQGTVGSGDVTTVVVVCGSNLFTIGGAAPAGGVSGLNGKVGLHDKLNGTDTDTITVSSNGSFAFPTPAQGGGGTSYVVNVSTQPSYPPASQTCTLSNPSGTVGTANITNIGVACTTNKFKIGGSVSGLTSGTLVLKDNGGDSLSITANGAFQFATPISSGLTYSVSVGTQPGGLFCSVQNHNGTVMNSDITNVSVTCVDAGVKCGNNFCSFSSCCNPGTSQARCTGFQGCSGLQMPCDDKADCSQGRICCVSRHNGNLAIQGISCTSSCTGDDIQLCDPGVPNECAAGTCQPYGQIPGYYACQ